MRRYPLVCTLGAGQAVGLAQHHCHKGKRAFKGSWSCAAAPWQFGVLHSAPQANSKEHCTAVHCLKV